MDAGAEAERPQKRVRFSGQANIIEFCQDSAPSVVESMQAEEDLSVLEELEEAEEEYDEPEELFTSDGIPIEPFHLRRERAEGFFDGEGNYVEYKLEPEGDAWLDSLG
eukprot:gene1130-1466_t